MNIRTCTWTRFKCIKYKNWRKETTETYINHQDLGQNVLLRWMAVLFVAKQCTLHHFCLTVSGISELGRPLLRECGHSFFAVVLKRLEKLHCLIIHEIMCQWFSENSWKISIVCQNLTYNDKKPSIRITIYINY